jgi:hypothetical protein
VVEHVDLPYVSGEPRERDHECKPTGILWRVQLEEPPWLPQRQREERGSYEYEADDHETANPVEFR